MFARFFIDRPIFAAVLSIIVTLAGATAVVGLPVTQYPEIAPPTVEVSAVYPGANAQVVADTVAAPIEQQVNGVEDMLYMTSQCTNDGSYRLTVTFRPGTNLNLAQVLVQNRVSLAQAVLPELVRRRGVTVKKKSPTVLMIVNLFSPDKSRDDLYLSNYATIQLRDELSRLPGVGDISFLGQRDYSMRVWLDPERLTARRLTTGDVARAIEQQNIQVAAGQIGQPPTEANQVFQFSMSTLGRLSNEQQFGDMVLKVDDQGRITRLRDVSRIELGALVYDQVCTLNQLPSVALSVYQLPGSNALQTAGQVRNKMVELRERFPTGVDYSIVYDTTPFIDESIDEVFVALRDAVILVSVVVLVFLRRWRAALIPLVAVPVAIVGTFAAMAAFGFNLNTLTLFGLVLAIGIVVDDAIVVVEAIEHHLEQGLLPRDAAIQAMSEVSGPVIAVGLVLSAVFVPCAFVSGVVGQFYRQFAVTIAISTVISAFNSLTLSPALAVLLLKPRDQAPGPPLPRWGLILLGGWAAYRFLPQLVTTTLPESLRAEFAAGAWNVGSWTAEKWLPWCCAGVGLLLSWPCARLANRCLDFAFGLFDIGFRHTTSLYTGIVSRLLRVSPLMILAYGGLLYVTYAAFVTTPAGFIPAQDKGYLLVNVQLPDSASLERTTRVMQEIEKLAGDIPGVRNTLSIAGQSLLMSAPAPNFGTMYVMLDEFHTRAARQQSIDAIRAELGASLDSAVQDGLVGIFGAPPIDGLGTAGGFRIVVEDRGNLGLRALQDVSARIAEEGQVTPGLVGAFSSFRSDTPWLYLDIDRDAAKARHVSLDELFNTLQVSLGSLYVNDFNRFGRTWQVNLQADASFRMQAEDLQRIQIRNDQGNMTPLSAIATLREVGGPLMLVRHNLYPSAIVSADAAPGISSGEAIQQLEAIATRQLLPSMRAEWTELALLQQRVGNTALIAFLLAVVLVFLVLAAQYESWSLPLAVILVVPMCLLCSIVGVRIAALDVNIFTQIGFVVLVGLACKNAILIVEFARARHAAGVPRREATLAACRLRLRPIVMTSLAFIIGVIPLILGEGAGAEMRYTLGTAVFAGMLGVTLFGIFLTPTFYDVIQRIVDWRQSVRRSIASGRR